MKITLNNIDPVNASLTIEVVKDDYAQKVKQSLKEISKTATIPGFRKGMVPLPFLQKMYGKSVLVDEVNKLVSDQLHDYINENKLNILGEPLPHEGEQKALDFNKQEDYEFTFDIGLAPEMNVKLTKEDKMPYYTIAITDEMIDKQINHFKANNGTYDQVDDIQENDIVKGLLVELDKDSVPKENGICYENAVLMPSYVKDEEEKSKFTGAKLGDVITFNPHKAYEENEAGLASFLKIKKEEVKNYRGNFTFEITEITRYKEAEINQDLFDKIYGPDVTSEEQFKEKIKEILAQQLISESEYKFIIDVRKLLDDKVNDIRFPDAFLKRWLLVSNPNQIVETLEEDYPKIITDLKFQLIKENILKENNIKVEEEDLLKAAFDTTREQFARYGISNIPADLLENYAQEMLKKKETLQNLINKVSETKLIAVLKEKVTLEYQEVTTEEFAKLFEQN
jgi:trigger factor